MIAKIHVRRETVALDLDPNRMTEKAIYDEIQTWGFYELATSKCLIEILKAGDLFLDVGAHVGYFSALASACGASVLAAEPDPVNFERYKRNNPLKVVAGWPSCVFPMAVGSKPGEVIFYTNADNDGGHALWNPGQHPFNAQSRQKMQDRIVHMTTVDAMLDNKVCHLLKIDTEGNEVEVLRGAEVALKEKRIHHIICEVNEFGLARCNGSEGELRRMMRQAGYITYVLNEWPATPLHDNQRVDSSGYVYNLLFSRIELASPRIR